MIAYLDLDGTLLGRGGSLVHDLDGAPSRDALEALLLLHEARVPVVLVSGRPAEGLREPARMVGAAGVIPELGAVDGDPAPGAPTAHERIARSGLPGRLEERAGGRLRRERGGPPRAGTHLFRGLLDEDLAGFVADASDGRLRLLDNGDAEGDGVRAVHLAPADAGKGPAVARDARARGAEPARCLAVGDGPEDLAMQEHVGAMALLANGVAVHPELAGRARWTTRARGSAGVLEAVRAWLGRD